MSSHSHEHSSPERNWAVQQQQQEHEASAEQAHAAAAAGPNTPAIGHHGEHQHEGHHDGEYDMSDDPLAIPGLFSHAGAQAGHVDPFARYLGDPPADSQSPPRLHAVDFQSSPLQTPRGAIAGSCATGLHQTGAGATHGHGSGASAAGPHALQTQYGARTAAGASGMQPLADSGGAHVSGGAHAADTRGSKRSRTLRRERAGVL
jgi:hypothetical protein